MSVSPDGPAEAHAGAGAPASLWRSAEERAAFLGRAEVRDVLAWLRLLTDPRDAASVVRALARPPIELSQVDLARVVQVARRLRVDMLSALAAAVESSPQITPQARERIERFQELRRRAAGALETARPDLFARTVLGVEGECADPGTAAESSNASTAPDAAHALLEATLHALREEVLDDVRRIAGRLSELRLDTDLDVSHGVVRYVELVKLAALLQRPPGERVATALPDLNARLQGALTPLQREIFQTSPLDEALLAAEHDCVTGGERSDGVTWAAEGAATAAQAAGTERLPGAGGVPGARAPSLAGVARGEPSLLSLLPRNGHGLVLSASDIETYRSCPLRYKFARVLRIPVEQTPQQRFGIVVHQVLERYHAAAGRTVAELLDLLDAAWRRAGFGAAPDERRLRERAATALARYHRRLADEPAEPVWFERSFSFRLGPHQLRGRVDRVDRLADGGDGYELIDYKTSRPKSPEQLGEDVQLSLYALAAREAWQLDSPRQAYHYVLDDVKVQVPSGRDEAWVKNTVLRVGEGILAQEFEPTPSPAACALCDYRILCPAARG